MITASTYLIKSLVYLLAVILIVSPLAPGSSSVRAEPSSDMTVADLVEKVVRASAVQIKMPTLSPNGRFLYYVVETTADAHPGTYDKPAASARQAWLQTLNREGEPVGKPRQLPAEGIWRPDNRLILLRDKRQTGSEIELELFDPVSTTRTALQIRPMNGGAAGLPQGLKVTPQDLMRYGSVNLADRYFDAGRWSGSGRYYAFIHAVVTSDSRSSGMRGWDGGIEPWKGIPSERLVETSYSPGRDGMLLIWDTYSGELRRVPGLAEKVASFDWSPDERTLVVETRSKKDLDIDGKIRTDLSIVDLNGRLIRAFTKHGSDETKPSWSPDGSTIAFLLYDGNESYTDWTTFQSPKVAFLNPINGDVTSIPKSENAVLPSYPHFTWSADSRSLSFYAPWNMGQALITADRVSLSLSVQPLQAASGGPVFDRSSISISRDGRLIAFIESTPVEPSDLFVVQRDGRGMFNGKAQRVTRLRNGFALRDAVRLEKLSWTSPDGKFTIHAQLLTPAWAWRNGRIFEPLPTVLSYIGGPIRIGARFGDQFGEMFALAAHGYAVLVPNTRGRPGWGYNEHFAHGIRDGKSRYGLPYQDAMAGINLLIAKGIIDPERMGVMGHSYGGTLASYTITQTHRFKAAINLDSTALNMLDGQNWPSGEPAMRLMIRNLYSITNPYSPEQQKMMIDESPALNTNRIRTPLLSIYAWRNSPRFSAEMFYRQLKMFNVPSSLIYYKMVHGPVGVSQTIDQVTRMVEWMDYWILGKPWIYPEREQEYVHARRKYAEVEPQGRSIATGSPSRGTVSQ